MPTPKAPDYKLTPRVLGRLLALRETVGLRRPMKRYLHDNCGGRGNAAELNRALKALNSLRGKAAAEVRQIADEWLAAQRSAAKKKRRAVRR